MHADATQPATPGSAQASPALNPSTPSLPAIPPTRPGEIPRVSQPPLYRAIIGWFCVPFAIVSVVFAGWLLVYPYFSEWVIEQAPGSQDDLSGGMRFYRVPEVILLTVRIALSLWLLWLARDLRRSRPGSEARLRRWCWFKLTIEVAMTLLTYLQMATHFGQRADLGPQEAFWASFGMAAWAALTGLAFPLGLLAWLLLPNVRKHEASLPKTLV